ncbi:MAG: alpha/beta fold hydrolase [Sulfobacillus sp.]
MSKPVLLATTVRGSGPTVVLLHGFAQDGRSMADLQDRLSAGFRTVAVDLPGHGRSLGIAAAPYVAETLGALSQLLDRLEVTQAALVGYSFGARLAAWAALDQPSRWWALVLESMSLALPEPQRQDRLSADLALAAQMSRESISAFVARWETHSVFASQQRVPASRLAAQRHIRMGQDPIGLAEALAGGGQARTGLSAEQLAGLAVPTLVLAGSEDQAYASQLERLRAAIPKAQGAVISGAGHNLHLEAPAEAAEAIWTFLSQVMTPRPDDQIRLSDQRRVR